MKFTDGTPLDAAAVKFNYERIKDPNTPPPSPNRSSANQITDMAVVDPAAGGRYLLGIECDGATYHSSATARDRDRLRRVMTRAKQGETQ